MSNKKLYMSLLRAKNRSYSFFNGVRRQVLPSLRTLTVIAIISTTVVFSSVYVGTNFFAAEGLQNFKSYSELFFYLQTHQNQFSSSSLILYGTQTLDANPGLRHSTTNVQVAGVDELDIVKTNGTYIYTVVNEEIVIIRAYPPETVEISARITPKGHPRGIFLYDSNRLVVISEILDPEPWIFWVSIEVFDVTDPASPYQINWVTCEGYFIGVRLIQNIIYLITGSPCVEYFRALNREYSTTIRIPRIGYFGVQVFIPATQIYYNPQTVDESFQYTSVLTLDISVPAALPQVQSYLIGASYGTVYVSQNNLYLACLQWNGREHTKIHRIQIQTGKATYAASGCIPGRLLNQFSLDEHEGHLRVATTYSGETTQLNGIYILNMAMDVVGSVEGLAPNEFIYSARFLGDMGYLVTFYKVDPLFVLNLTEPTNPQLLSELKIPGFSNYLHPLDETHLLGIGKDVKFEDDIDIWWHQGIKISFFNTTDPFDPREYTRLIIGVRGSSSPVLNDHKAILVDPEINLLAVPIKRTEYIDNTTVHDPSEYGTPVWQGAYVFYIDHLTATLNIRGQITHIDNLQAFRENPFDFKHQFIQRTGYIESVFYSISEDKITFHNLSDLTFICSLDL